MFTQTENNDIAIQNLLLELFENGILNVASGGSLKQLVNQCNSKFILTNILGACDVTQNFSFNRTSDLSAPQEWENTIFMSKVMIHFNEKQYDRLYGLINNFENKNDFIKDNLIVRYIQLLSLYLLWDDKTSVLSSLDDGLIGDSHYTQESVDGENIQGVAFVQEMKQIKTISVPIMVNLPFILNEINQAIDKYYLSEDSFALSCFYLLKGIILNKQNNKKKAIEALTHSLRKNPYNWEAFREICKCIERVEEVSILLDFISKQLKYTLLFEFFQIECWSFFFQTCNRDVYIEKLASLLLIFPSSHYLMIKNATLAFELKDLVQSEFLFDSIIETDPYSLEAMDIYSNILYVTGNIPKLKTLLVEAKTINELSTECQTISGNFQSLMKNHEKAIIHFKRAIKLLYSNDQQRSKLYTLIGHEFIELTNHHAAISSYRKAATLDSRNYAAWMGLGLGYDILKQYQFSVYYYQKCVSIKMDDSRGWLSLGESYIELAKWNQAVQMITRSYQNSLTRSKKAKSAEKIIDIYLKNLNNISGAREWNKKLLLDAQVDEYYIKACKWLCKDAVENLKNKEDALHYFNLLKSSGIIMDQYIYLDLESNYFPA